MTYNIYVDLAFLWAFIINLLLLYVSRCLLKTNISIRRLCIDSLLISCVCTGEYVMFYSFSRTFQNTLYVLTYFLLLYLLYRLHHLQTSLLHIYAVYVLISFAMALLLLMLEYSLEKGPLQTAAYAVFFICAGVSIYFIRRTKHAFSCKACVHPVELNIHGRCYLSEAYIDTGNSLRDLAGRDVLITDIYYAGELLGNGFRCILDSYGQSKSFDYVKANSISDIYFRPIPYRTVSSDFSIMPGFTADSVLYPETGRLYRNITVAISPNRLMLTKNTKLLSNRNLQP